MARYTGPQFKKSRRLGFSTLETGKEFSKGKQREYAPGQHGQIRKKHSDFAVHLFEKQKVKFTYGVSEKHMKKYYLKATKQEGITGHNLLINLEKRLDNVVYRMGFASTRRQARQFVNHGHFTLNGKKADIASMVVNAKDIVEVKPKSQSIKFIVENLKNGKISEWVSVKGFKGTFDRNPERNEFLKSIKESLLVEQYSK
ncbi:MAG: 30S ribosomal protein S4 [Mollicutes bacterium PWAP]|nr:30S ribosomal protein S4 [Mollicutes bacterium PWAP]